MADPVSDIISSWFDPIAGEVKAEKAEKAPKPKGRIAPIAGKIQRAGGPQRYAQTAARTKANLRTVQEQGRKAEALADALYASTAKELRLVFDQATGQPKYWAEVDVPPTDKEITALARKVEKGIAEVERAAGYADAAVKTLRQIRSGGGGPRSFQPIGEALAQASDRKEKTVYYDVAAGEPAKMDGKHPKVGRPNKAGEKRSAVVTNDGRTFKRWIVSAAGTGRWQADKPPKGYIVPPRPAKKPTKKEPKLPAWMYDQRQGPARRRQPSMDYSDAEAAQQREYYRQTYGSPSGGGDGGGGGGGRTDNAQTAQSQAAQAAAEEAARAAAEAARAAERASRASRASRAQTVMEGVTPPPSTGTMRDSRVLRSTSPATVVAGPNMFGSAFRDQLADELARPGSVTYNMAWTAFSNLAAQAGMVVSTANPTHARAFRGLWQAALDEIEWDSIRGPQDGRRAIVEYIADVNVATVPDLF